MAANLFILCPGQGAQIVGMGKSLCDSSVSARELFAVANKVLGFDLTSICFSGPEDRLNQTDIAQAAVFSMQVALTALWRAWGIEPDGVIGQSLGGWKYLCVMFCNEVLDEFLKLNSVHPI